MYVIGGPHVLIMGSSGARKSRSWAIPRILQAIRRGESLILTDPKGGAPRSIVKSYSLAA